MTVVHKNQIVRGSLFRAQVRGFITELAQGFICPRSGTDSTILKCDHTVHCMIRTISVFKSLCVMYRCEMNIKKNV